MDIFTHKFCMFLDGWVYHRLTLIMFRAPGCGLIEYYALSIKSNLLWVLSTCGLVYKKDYA